MKVHQNRRESPCTEASSQCPDPLPQALPWLSWLLAQDLGNREKAQPASLGHSWNVELLKRPGFLCGDVVVLCK